jgi:hypothetical protein
MSVKNLDEGWEQLQQAFYDICELCENNNKPWNEVCNLCLSCDVYKIQDKTKTIYDVRWLAGK